MEVSEFLDECAWLRIAYVGSLNFNEISEQRNPKN